MLIFFRVFSGSIAGFPLKGVGFRVCFEGSC